MGDIPIHSQCGDGDVCSYVDMVALVEVQIRSSQVELWRTAPLETAHDGVLALGAMVPQHPVGHPISHATIFSDTDLLSDF